MRHFSQELDQKTSPPFTRFEKHVLQGTTRITKVQKEPQGPVRNVYIGSVNGNVNRLDLPLFQTILDLQNVLLFNTF